MNPVYPYCFFKVKLWREKNEIQKSRNNWIKEKRLHRRKRKFFWDNKFERTVTQSDQIVSIGFNFHLDSMRLLSVMWSLRKKFEAAHTKIPRTFSSVRKQRMIGKVHVVSIGVLVLLDGHFVTHSRIVIDYLKASIIYPLDTIANNCFLSSWRLLKNCWFKKCVDYMSALLRYLYYL